MRWRRRELVWAWPWSYQRVCSYYGSKNEVMREDEDDGDGLSLSCRRGSLTRSWPRLGSPLRPCMHTIDQCRCFRRAFRCQLSAHRQSDSHRSDHFEHMCHLKSLRLRPDANDLVAVQCIFTVTNVYSNAAPFEGRLQLARIPYATRSDPSASSPLPGLSLLLPSQTTSMRPNANQPSRSKSAIR